METMFIQLEKYEDAEVEVDFEYNEAEEYEIYDLDLGGYGGIGSFSEIYSVRLNGVCILNVLSLEAICDIDERITKKFEIENS
jgi:hypothetical protein